MRHLQKLTEGSLNKQKCFIARLCWAALLVSSPLLAQTGNAPLPTMPKAAAFEMMLTLLAVTPENPQLRQDRARYIEADVIGLSVQDIVATELAVEQYRVQNNALIQSIEAAKLAGALSADQLKGFSVRHHALIHSQAAALKASLTPDGVRQVNVYLRSLRQSAKSGNSNAK